MDDLAEEWMKAPRFRVEYDTLKEEFALAATLIDARARSHLSQAQVALRMGTSRTAVVRLEGGRANPSMKTLQRFAAATGTKLRISFEPAAGAAEPVDAARLRLQQ